MTKESAKQLPNAIPIRLFRYPDYVDKIYYDFESREKELLEKIKELEEYKFMYEGLCK